VVRPPVDGSVCDIGTGDGIVDAGPPDGHSQQASNIAALGLHIKSRFVHDLTSLNLDDATGRQKGEAERVTDSLYVPVFLTNSGQPQKKLGKKGKC